ncbi:MAG: cupin domain-containing protein [Bacteroidia bacterium]|jgi:quercetin dioxygenase-like cupin family protein
MYYSHHEIANNQTEEGIKIRVTRQEESMQMTELELRKGAVLPEHMHRSEHSGYILQGKIRMYIDGVLKELVQGDSWCIGKNICHHTVALEDSVVIEVFEIEQEKIAGEKFVLESTL